MADIAAQVGSSVTSLSEELSVIANNLANVNTAGFKRSCNSFVRQLNNQLAGSQAQPSGEVDLKSMLDFSQGSIVQTGRELDCALSGKGLFVIETPDGPLYTRNGSFQVNANGQIVDSKGRIVAGQAGPITVPAGTSLSQLSVLSDGTINAGSAAIGRLQIVDFKDNEEKLIPAGFNCYSMPDKEVRAEAAGNVVVKQGYQESSNVQIVDELVDMIMVSRLYEANMKLISAGSDASKSLIGVAMG
jgi:flagellar basal-body rod protein FlgF